MNAGLIVLHSLRLHKIVQSLSVKHEIEMQAAEPTLSPETTRKKDESGGEGEGGPRPNLQIQSHSDHHSCWPV